MCRQTSPPCDGSFGGKVDCFGHLSGFSWSHFGPSHKVKFSSSEGNNPHVAQSARFSKPLTWFQRSGEMSSIKEDTITDVGFESAWTTHKPVEDDCTVRPCGNIFQ